MTPTPHDVLDRYIDVYGEDSLFPVATTAIGRLACIASEEILFPEVARCLAVRGAEVIVHSTSEASSPADTNKDVARRARAQENLVYVVSANSAGIDGSPIPGASTDGKSQIVDFDGRVLVQAGGGESMVANAEIDLPALRRARSRPGMTNLLSRTRFELYARTYSRTTVHEANGLGDGSRAPERSFFIDAQRAAITRLFGNSR
jgi:predicted amidohydrolase